MNKFLICEAALHGDGNKFYYLNLIKELRNMWPGWPPIVFKLQHWCDPDSPWAERVSAVHGRPPLNSVTVDDLVEIGRAAREAGFGYAVTFHDAPGISNAFDGVIPPLTHLKLGAFDFATYEMRGRAYRLCYQYNLGLVASVFGVSRMTLSSILATDPVPERTVLLLGYSRYPANEVLPSSEGLDLPFGYSAHNVPSLAYKYAKHALRNGANVIETHVTMRPCSLRPLPGDMCVSIDIDMFMKIAKKCGETWAN